VTFGLRRAASLLGLSIICLVAGSSTASAATYTFDPQLSLTGNCVTSKVDPIPDPGCPGGDHPPSGAFSSPRSVATDSFGNIFVASWGNESSGGSEGRIDIFDPEGNFLTEILDPQGPRNLAVDSQGNLYVFDLSPGEYGKLMLYSPSTYNPAAGEVEYGNAPVLIEEIPWFFAGIAVNRDNDHLFVHRQFRVYEYGSEEEDNVLLDSEIGEGNVAGTAQGLAVDAARDRLYVSSDNVVSIFDLNAPYNFLGTIDGTTTPAGEFGSLITLAVDEATGDLFVFDGDRTNRVYQLTKDGEYVSTIEHDFQYVYGAEIGIDNGPSSPNAGYLFVPSHPLGIGHSFAFGPPPPAFPPEVESIDYGEVSERDAVLEAEVASGNLKTTYSFQVTTQESFEREGFASASVAGGGEIAASAASVHVSAVAANLLPDTAYRFRVVATNEDGSDEAEGGFTTYPADSTQDACLNAAQRTGASALLPDCRAYELVSPADTNARSPLGVGYLGVYFATREASPTGDKVSFMIEGGSIPGSNATGSLGGDNYLSVRGPTGWNTSLAGPSGAESTGPLPGSTSPDQGYTFWVATGEGSAVVDDQPTQYVRYPDGHSALVGRGSLRTDPAAEGRLISQHGGHIVFVSSGRAGKTPVQLEPNAPPSGTQAIYDRTSDEVTHVISLLPGDKTPAAGQDALYVGASLDGEGVAFEIDGTLYLRHDNEETYEIDSGVDFAGVAEGGSRIFYMKAGDLFAFDLAKDEEIRFSQSGNVTPVNISADGSTAYFTSPGVLTGDQNPHGDSPVSGAQNLYLSRAGQISFVGTVTERDVIGEDSGNGQLDGLGLWMAAVGPGSAEAPGRFGIDPSRTTPDGSVLLFESQASLTPYGSDGHTHVYRYDFLAGSLDCLSCNPTGAPSSGDASLQTVASSQGAPGPFGPFALVANLRADGRRAFFQSTEALVARDTDGLLDVYEWEAQGVGSCQRPRGCTYLISSGHSSRVEYLYAASDSGDDVFFLSSDLLLPSDSDETPSIYDARVGGGFSEATKADCEGESCRATSTSPPALPVARTPVVGANDNVRPKRCHKGKRRVVRRGKVRCVKKHRRHRNADAKRGGAK